jgi:hypothetical protein
LFFRERRLRLRLRSRRGSGRERRRGLCSLRIGASPQAGLSLGCPCPEAPCADPNFEAPGLAPFSFLLFKEIDREEDGVTYAVQYTADNIEQYRTYVEVHAAAMRQKGIDKWGERFIAFRTVMERVVI